MKKILIYTGISIGSIMLCLYLAFLFILPNVIDLNKYVPMLQEIAKEQLNLNLEIQNPKIVTTPILEAGIKTDRVKVSLSDGSPLIDTDGLKAKVSLPAALFLTVRISCIDMINPKITLDTNDECTQYKIITEVENMLNRKNQEVKDEMEEHSFNSDWIKIVIPHIIAKNYNIEVNDKKYNHKITLKGDELKVGYFNHEKLKVKTYMYLMSDEKQNVTANVKLDTFLPPKRKDELDADDDKAEKIEIPFINLVKIYQHYDLETHINSKLKVRKDDKNQLKLKGFFNIDDFTLKLAKYQLPKCYFHSKFHGRAANIDTNLYVTPDEHINISGNVDYNKPAIDLVFSGNKIYFNDLIIFSKALLDSFGINNDLGNLKGQGYILANAKIKTNFKKLKSDGKIIIRDGAAINNKIGLVVTGTNSDLLFDNNVFKIDNTRIYVSGQPLTINGSIDNKAVADLFIKTSNLPITGLYRALAPSNIKKSIIMKSGNISIDAKINGKLKKSLSTLKFGLANLSICTHDNSLILNNGDLGLTVMYDLSEDILKGNIINNGLNLTIPSTASGIRDNNLTVNFDNEKIVINPSNFLVNSASHIKIGGQISDYTKSPLINISGDGTLMANDLKKFAGIAAAPYISARGSMPVKLKLSGNDKKLFALVQVLSSANNFITPVYFKSLRGVSCITQAKILYKGDRLNVKDTGVFVTHNSFTDDYSANMSGAEPVIKMHGTIARLDTIAPRINLLKLNIKPLDGTIYALRGSRFKLKGDVSAYGIISNPVAHGEIDIDGLNIPSLLTKADSLGIKFNGHSVRFFADNINLNGSDINFSANSNYEFSPVTRLHRVDVTSNDFNVEKVMKVVEASTKVLPNSGGAVSSSGSSANIPVEAMGRFNFRKIQTGNIVLNDTRGRLLLAHNVLHLRPLVTNVFKGNVRGKIGVNLLTSAIDMELAGNNIDTAQALLDAANMKDSLSGTTSFNLKAGLSGSTYEEQMKSLKGGLNFSIKDGVFGPIGKIENLILAENIRESQFFQTALGGILNKLTTIDTAHFSDLKGRVNFGGGQAVLTPITSQGNVMSLYVAGNYDLLKNEADMTVRGRLGSFISDMLGPISALNPINLVKATPGINVVMAKAFSLFTVAITPEEMDLIPTFVKVQDDLAATKFQIILRGDASKPLSMIKSFKWLALQSDIDNAKNFTDNMPEEYLLADPTTPEAQAAAEAKAKEDAKLINRVKRKFDKSKS